MNVIFRKICDDNVLVDQSVCIDWLVKYAPIINQYILDDVYNVDETGLFFKCLPSQTSVIKGEDCSNRKINKETVTILLRLNITCIDITTINWKIRKT